MTVYLDLVMVLNFLVDFLLLLGTNRLSGFPAQGKRCALGAALGAVYSGACMLPEFRFLGSLLWRTVFLGLMAVVSFGWNRSVVKRGGVFLLLSMALGGMAVSMGKGDLPALVLAAAGVWLLCRVSFGERIGGQEYVPLTICYRGTTVSVIALRDSGNTLQDPITGEQVFLISGNLAEKLTGLSQHQLRSPLETMAKRPVSGLRLIPYRAVGCEKGMLLGMRFENVKVDAKQVKAVVAFVPEGMGSGMHQALVTVS